MLFPSILSYLLSWLLKLNYCLSNKETVGFMNERLFCHKKAEHAWVCMGSGLGERWVTSCRPLRFSLWEYYTWRNKLQLKRAPQKQTNQFIKLVLRKPILWQRLAFQRPCLKDVNEGVEGLGTGWSLSVVFHSTTERVSDDSRVCGNWGKFPIFPLTHLWGLNGVRPNFHSLFSSIHFSIFYFSIFHFSEDCRRFSELWLFISEDFRRWFHVVSAFMYNSM